MSKKYYSYVLLVLLVILLNLGHLTKSSAQLSTPTPKPTLNPSTSPDLAIRNPHHPPRLTNPQASQTDIIYQLPVVKFRVDSGDDLDQYLNAASSPLDFYIDLQGFTLPITQSTQVTLKVWDVDEEGNPNSPDCLVEVDKLYVNGTYLGNLTGANG